MKLNLLTITALSIGLLAANCAVHAAQPDALTSQLAPKLASVLGNAPIEKVSPSGHAGLYEVLTPNGIVYTDKAGSFVSFGPIVDTATKANLTRKRLEELSAFEFKELPFKDAIKTVKGDGSRVIATFEDPNCGFCKKLMQEIAKLDNVTVYTFLIPILGPDSATKSKAIWCATDHGKAWTGYMAGTSALPAQPAGNCDTPFARNEQIKRRLRITGTPTILFPDNSRVPGYVTAGDLEAKLKK